eukprot:Em0005g712a
MPSRNRKKRTKQRAEYLQKQEENKAKARERYKADPEKKKASVRESYKADPEKKKASVRESYKADPEKKKASVRESYKADPEKKKASVRESYIANIEPKRAAKRQRYGEDLEENRAAKKQRYGEDLEENRAAKRQRYGEDLEENRAVKRQRYQESVEENRAAKRRIYRGNSATIKAARMSRYWKGRRTTTTTTTTTQSYSLFEPNSRTLAEYGVSLEKAILKDSELLSDVNNAFCNSHPLLAQKVVTRSARAAVTTGSYGPNGQWCWIQGRRFGCEYLTGFIEQFVTFYGPLILLLVLESSAMLIMLVTVYYRSCKKGNVSVFGSGQNKTVFKQLIPLVAYPIIFCTFSIPPLINRVYELTSPNYGLRIFSSTCFPISSLAAGLTLTAHIAIVTCFARRHSYRAQYEVIYGSEEVVTFKQETQTNVNSNTSTYIAPDSTQ